MAFGRNRCEASRYGAVASLGVEAEAFAGGEDFDGEDIPDVERDDVGDKKIYVPG